MFFTELNFFAIELMALGDGIFRSRAASLLRASTPLASHPSAPDAIKEKGSKTSVEPPLTAEEKQDTRHGEPESAQSTLSTGRPYQSSGQDAVAHDREAQRVVRTIPGKNLALSIPQSSKVMDLYKLTVSVYYSLGAPR